MPNWCENGLFIQHEDKEMIDRAEKAFNEKNLFNEFHPCPKELIDTVAGHLGEGYAQELNQFKMQLNMKYFDAKDWFDWCIKNWGTKWDIDPCNCNRVNEKAISMSFNTAWSPPLEFYEHLEGLGFVVDATYFEGGMNFCGAWHNGCDESYDINGDSQWVIDNIPAEIDNEFCISESMAQWEEEEKNETL